MTSVSRSHFQRVRSALTLGAVGLLCAGCGTFQLASAVYPPAGNSPEQQQLDNLTCKDQAKLEANSPGRQVGAFLLGFTIVGAPLAYEMERSTQRDVYKTCMESRGYGIVAANDGAASNRSTPTGSAALDRPSGANARTTPPPAPPAVVAPPPVSQVVISAPAAAPAAVVAPVQAAAAATTQSPTGQRDEAVQLQKLKELRDRGLISEEEYARKRKEILDRL